MAYRKIINGVPVTSGSGNMNKIDLGAMTARNELLNRDTNAKAPKSRLKVNYGQLADIAGTYGSNIMNSFRKPPMPPVPENVSPVTLRRISLDNSRNNINRQGRIADLSAERSGLDSNGVSAMKAATLSAKLNATSDVNAQEANMNTQISNQQAQINGSIDAQNVGQRNQWGNEIVGMRIAQQREQSQNQANAADKYMAIGNEKAKAQLEMDKYRTMTQLFKESGVYDRYLKAQKDAGITDPTGIDKQYKTKNTFSTGGILRKVFNYK